MQDAVAKVLTERSRETAYRSIPLALSALAHAAVIFFALTAANREAPLPIHTITLKLAAPSTPGSLASPSVTKANSRKAKKIEPPKAVEKPPEVEPPKPKEKTSSGEALFGRSELKAPTKPTPAAAHPPLAAPAPNTSTATEAVVPAVGKAGVTSIEGGPFPYSVYIDRMVGLVGNRWFRPDGGGDPIVQVYFAIQRDGTVRDVKIEKSSGVASFDRAAYRAVIESSPLPPLPAAYSGTFIGVHLTFH
jgi:protein TonB